MTYIKITRHGTIFINISFLALGFSQVPSIALYIIHDTLKLLHERTENRKIIMRFFGEV